MCSQLRSSGSAGAAASRQKNRSQSPPWLKLCRSWHRGSTRPRVFPPTWPRDWTASKFGWNRSRPPDFDEERDADRLYVDFDSGGQEAADLEATAEIVQTVSQVAFDDDILMVTGDVSAGKWSYLYDKSTGEELTASGTITVAEVWDAAEQDFDTIHR